MATKERGHEKSNLHSIKREQNMKNFTNLARLPNEIRYATWSDLATWGIERVGPANKYTCEVNLPEGWQVKQSDHPHWQELSDNHGRNRADIYICTDDCGTRAFFAPRRRFTTIFEVAHNNKELRVLVMDDKDALYHTPWVPLRHELCESHPDQYHDKQAHDRAENLAKTWLMQNFPYWQNCLQYWDFDF